MRVLDRKLFRELWQIKGQALAIAAVIACGVATFVMAANTLVSLERSRDSYYDRYRFAHIFAQARRAPLSLATRIAEIPGVAQVQTRIVQDVTLDIPDLNEPAVGRLISVPDRREPMLNDLHLRAGRYVQPNARGEVLANEAFAEAHGFTPGDQFDAVINGTLETLTIVGIALSPEYVLQLKAGDAVPDDKRFGVFWMSRTQLEAAFDMKGAFNNITLRLMHGASEAEVIARLDNLTETYGGVGAHDRTEQVSARYLADEIKGLRGMGLIAPMIFLGVAGFLLNVVMNRLISTQREEIAVLKAFGYSHGEVGRHYLKLALLITGVGVVCGTLLGVKLGQGMTSMYVQFYRFPIFRFEFDVRVAVLALLIASAAAVVGSWGAVRRAVRLPPAEAMRPEPPARYRPTVIEQLGLQRLFTQPARMVMRQLERHPFKSLLSAFGISLAVAILVLGNFMVDAISYLMDFQYFVAQRHDVSVTFVEPTSHAAEFELNHFPGVLHAETYRSVPARLRFEHHSRRVAVMGLEHERELFRLVDADEQIITLPPDGLLLSRTLAGLLHAEPGDVVTVEVLEGDRPVRQVPVQATITEFAGTNAYMHRDALHRLMREGRTISGAWLSVDGRHLDNLYSELKETPRVAGVSVKSAALQSFEDTVAENQLRMQSFMVMFACVIAFGVVYNTARISLSERSRELATMRVIGFTRGEISLILLGELSVVTLLALPLGMIEGYGLAAFVVWSFDSELYRIPLVVSRQTYAFSAAVTLAAAVVSGLIVRRRLDHLDLVGVLKSRE